jgi:UDP-N-acetylglucosamine--N-acetylmuramyl-(pentapeptide) pyrophosphoryl-undecaprenol N-acetylglucosamine transferase
MKHFMFVGGGTGGHFYPLVAVAERLNAHQGQASKYKLFYIGPDKYNEEDLQKNNIAFVHCPAGKKRRYFSMLNYLDFIVTFYAFFVAVWKLYKVYPDVVFSKGSYTSVPVTLAAALLRIPIVIHESDSKPGKANKLAAKFARYIAISFDAVAKYFPDKKTALTGIPIRYAFMQQAENPLRELGIPSDKPVIFVTGGSSGAVRLNNFILNSLDELLPHYTIIHQTGDDNEETVEQTAASLISDKALLDHYFIRGTLSAREMDLAQSAATLIISRAGAGTIFEIARKGKPSILIPIPEEISHDQRNNAYEYARYGAAVVLEEGNLVDDLLEAEIKRILDDERQYRNMSIAAKQFAKDDAAEQLAGVLISIADEHN